MIIILTADGVFSEEGICHSPVAGFDNGFYTYIHTIPDHAFRTDRKCYLCSMNSDRKCDPPIYSSARPISLS